MANAYKPLLQPVQTRSWVWATVAWDESHTFPKLTAGAELVMHPQWGAPEGWRLALGGEPPPFTAGSRQLYTSERL